MSHKTFTFIGAVAIALVALVFAMRLPVTTAQSSIDWSQSLIMPDRDPVRPGETVAFHIWVVNSSTITAENVFVYNPIPEHTRYVETAGPDTFPITGAPTSTQALKDTVLPEAVKPGYAYDASTGETYLEDDVDPDDVIAVGWAGDVHTGTVDPVLIGLVVEVEDIDPGDPFVHDPYVEDVARIYYDGYHEADIRGGVRVEVGGVDVSPDPDPHREFEDAGDGFVLTYTHTVTNTGSFTDTYELTLASDWPASMLWWEEGTLVWPDGTARFPLTLVPGMTETFVVSVTVPAGACGTNHAVVEAASPSGAYDAVTDTAVIPCYSYLPWLTRNYTPPTVQTVITVPVSEGTLASVFTMGDDHDDALNLKEAVRYGDDFEIRIEPWDMSIYYQLKRTYLEIPLPNNLPGEVVTACLNWRPTARGSTDSPEHDRPSLPPPLVNFHLGTWGPQSLGDIGKATLWTAYGDLVGQYDTTPVYNPEEWWTVERVCTPLNVDIQEGDVLRLAVRDSEDHVDMREAYDYKGSRRVKDVRKDFWLEMTLE